MVKRWRRWCGLPFGLMLFRRSRRSSRRKSGGPPLFELPLQVPRNVAHNPPPGSAPRWGLNAWGALIEVPKRCRGESASGAGARGQPGLGHRHHLGAGPIKFIRDSGAQRCMDGFPGREFLRHLLENAISAVRVDYQTCTAVEGDGFGLPRPCGRLGGSIPIARANPMADARLCAQLQPSP